MVARRSLEAHPFVPLPVRTSGGRGPQVPAADHAGLDPRGKDLIVFLDDASHATISGLDLVSVIETVAA